MNAITKIERDRDLDGCPYARAISIHCPNISSWEMAARVELAMLRDQAAKGMHLAETDSAYVLLLEVARTASPAVYAKRRVGDLMMLVSALKLTMMSARALERAQRDG